MSFITPMLAAPMPESLTILPGQYAVTEKYDGHRIEVEIGGAGQSDLFTVGKPTRAWSRDGLSRILPRHIKDELGRLPEGIYDGELLVPGKRSYGVTELANSDALVYVVFDILHLLGENVMDVAYDFRYAMLREMFTHRSNSDLRAVRLAPSTPIDSIEEVRTCCNEVWSRDGEGLILKRRASHYLPGKRPKADWIKMKQLRSAKLQIIGYEYGKLGPYSRVRLEDEDGIRTAVKVRNTELRNAIERDPDAFLKQWLWIEYQERTQPDNNYRHPRWDRLEESV